VISAGVASLWLKEREHGEAILAHELCHVVMNDPGRAFKARSLSQNYEALFAVAGLAFTCGIFAIGGGSFGPLLLVGVAVPLFFLVTFANGHVTESEFAADLSAAIFASPKAVISLLQMGELADGRSIFRRLAFRSLTGKQRLERLQYLCDRYEKASHEEAEQP
jgi:Zn-dependent protease with chaperone function